MSNEITQEIRDRFEVVIGLEVHVQLLTQTKIFSPAPATFGGVPNSHVGPVDLGLPGVLPVINRRAVELAMRAGFALGCEVRDRSQFARKNYFYPDMAKGYQISQFEHPICEHGELMITPDIPGQPPGEDAEAKRVRINRIHLEEDAGKSTHVDQEPYSLVDLNRAGVGLIEIVTEPDIRSADEAIGYLKELRNIMMYLGISDGNMQEGSFRCDANISVRPRGQKELGTRSELKNINSFKFIRDALNFEADRQIALIESGGEVVQETRLYNPERGETFAMRSKAESPDYRYFPEPDLPPLIIDEAWMQAVKAGLPELPAARRRRYQEVYGLSAYDAAVLTDERALAEYFEAGVRALAASSEKAGSAPDLNPLVKSLANWTINELLARLDADTNLEAVQVRPAALARLIELINDATISGKIAKRVFDEMLESGDLPDNIVEKRGLKQISDPGAIGAEIEKIMDGHPEQVEAYRGGNTKITGWFVGQVMKATRGQANPKMVNQILRKYLAGEDQKTK